MKKGVCLRDCDTCRLNNLCGGCSMCEMPFCKRDCKNCFSLCPKRKAAFIYLEELIKKDEMKENGLVSLPTLIPVLPDRMSDNFYLPDKYNLISIHPNSFFSSNGEKIAKVYRRKGIKGALNLSGEFEALLHFYTKDRILEGFYDKRRELYNSLKDFELKLIISPNFSVYEDAPRMDHMANIMRSRKVYNELLDKGFSSAPDIGWYNLFDLDNWLNYIHKSNIKIIATSFQTVGTGIRPENTYVHYGIGFKYLLNNLPNDTEVILAGIASKRKLKMILEKTGRKFHILNQAAYIHSRKGELSETGKKADIRFTKNEIFLRNLSFYEKEYEEVKRCQNKEEQAVLPTELRKMKDLKI